MNALGTHLLLELRQCNPASLDDLEFIKETMIAAAKFMDAQIIGESFHRFNPQGITGVLAIAESHLSIHTWPELGYAAADIFTCGSSFQPQAAAPAHHRENGVQGPVHTDNQAGREDPGRRRPFLNTAQP